MVWQYDPYAFPLFASAAVNWGLTVFMWRRRRVPGGFAFMLLLLAAGEWSFSAAGKSLAVDLYSNVLWDKAAYLGLVSVAVLWLVFVLQYTGRGAWLRTRNLLLLWVVPILTVLLAWTNEAHHLIYSAYWMVSFGSLSMSEVTYGVWFYFLVAYSYLLVFLGVGLLLQLGLRSQGPLRRQSVVLVVGALLPLAGDAVNVIGYHYPADLAPLTFCFTGLLGFWVVFRLQLLKIMPVAREAVFRGMGDGVIVIDAGGRVVDINPAGEEFLGCNAAGVTGESAEVFFRSRGVEGSFLEDTHSEIVLVNGVRRYFDVRSSHLTNRRGDSIGQIVVLRDETERRRLEDSLLRSEARVRGVLAALPDLVFEVNSDGVLLNYYAATPSDLGYPPEAFLGKSVREVLPSQLADSIEAAMTAARKTGTVQLVEYQLPTLNGRLAWWEARIAPTSTGFVDVVRNITERKRAEEKLSQSEKRYRSLFDQTLDGVYRSTHEGRFADVNPAFVKMFGYSSKQDMLDIQDIKKELYFSPEDRASHFLDTGQEKVEVFRMRRKGGSEIWVEDHGRYVHDERGNVMFHEGILRDVTERVRAELNLRLQAEITENMFEGLVLVRQADGVIVQTNPRFEAMFGYSPSELAGKNMATVIAPMDGKSSEDVAEEIISAVRETGSWTGEVRSVSKEGAPFWCQANVSALESSEYGAIWVATHQDITERKRLQEALRRRVQELDSLQETLLEITGQHDLSQLLNRIVERAAALLDAPGGGLYLCDHEKQEARCVVSYNTKVSAVGLVLKYGEGAAGVVAQTGNPLIIDDYRTWPGRAAAYEEDRPFGAVLSAPMIWQGQVIGVIHILRYDTRRFTEENLALLRLFANHAAVAVENARLYGRVEQHAAQLENKVEERTRKLAESEKRFRELADLLPQVVYEIDERGYFTFVNRSALTITGYTHDDIAKGLDALQLFAESDRDRVKKNIGRVLAGETLGSTEYVARRKDGSTFPVLITSTRIIRGGRAAGLRGIVMDITERKQMEDRLLKAERLAAVGETAAMVGHDLRNPLQAISAATYVLKKNLTPPANERTREMLEAIENGVRYADRIVSDLTEYSQDLRLELSETTPKSLIREAIQQVKIPKNIVVSDSTSDDPKVRVDRAKIKRIFINLIENAIDAMATGGKLEISSIRSNSHLEVKFTDTGQGIPENVLRELWKPLITTKPKGMGLGLAICKRIAEAHSGSISVESRIGEGTTFTLELPINPPEGAKKA